MGMVLSFCGLRLQTSSAQQVLFNAGQPGFPHICVWSVLSHVVLHHHGRSAGTYCSLEGKECSVLLFEWKISIFFCVIICTNFLF